MKKKIILLVLCAILLLMFTSSSYGGFDPNYMEREEADPWEEMKSPSRDGAVIFLDKARDDIISILILRVLAKDFISIRDRRFDSSDKACLCKPPAPAER